MINNNQTPTNNPTVSIFLRCPEPLTDWLKNKADEQGFRSVQEFILQILREKKGLEIPEAESAPAEVAV
jgi:hypothetical protein